VLAGAGLALYAWGLPPFANGQERTDNAYLRGQTTVIAPQVSGYVTEVLVQDFTAVEAGQPLVRVDDRIARQRVAQARAQLAAQQAQLANSAQSQRSAEAAVLGQDAGLSNAGAQLQRAQADVRRAQALVADGSISQREMDQTLAVLRQAEATQRQAEAQRAGGREQVRAVTVGREALVAGVEAAQAQLQLAEIDLANTVIKAPANGHLGEVGVRLGQFVTAGTQLMALVPEKVWVVANFKEQQIAQMRVGQPVRVRIDALPDLKLQGTVENLSPAAGSEFSVIKPDNASGNFVKVAQRIPVRIALDAEAAAAAQLRPGMSVEAVVDTRANGAHS
jgi:multidrug resistance efflux pump